MELKKLVALFFAGVAVGVCAGESEGLQAKICKAFGEDDNFFYCFFIPQEKGYVRDFTNYDNSIVYQFTPWHDLAYRDTAQYCASCSAVVARRAYVWHHIALDFDDKYFGNRGKIFKMYWRLYGDKAAEVVLWDGKWAPDFRLDADGIVETQIIKLRDGSAYTFALVVKNGTDTDFVIPKDRAEGNRLSFQLASGEELFCDISAEAWQNGRRLAAGETTYARIDISSIFEDNGLSAKSLPGGVYTLQWQLAGAENVRVKEFYYYQPPEVQFIEVLSAEIADSTTLHFRWKPNDRTRYNVFHYKDGKFAPWVIWGETGSRAYKQLSESELQRGEVVYTLFGYAHPDYGHGPRGAPSDAGRLVGKQTLRFSLTDIPAKSE